MHYPAMSAASASLVSQNLHLAQAIARKNKRLYAWYTDDELVAETYYALCTAATNWESYCQSRGFDPSRQDYFRSYALRRMKGAIIDLQRASDPYTRKERAILKQEPTASSPRPPPRGVFLPTDIFWDHASSSIAASTLTPHDISEWNEIAAIASSLFLSLPHYNRLYTAYVMMKNPSDPLPAYVQKITSTSIRYIVVSTLDALQLAHPPFSLSLAKNNKPFTDAHVASYLSTHNLTPSALIERFLSALREEPGMLVDMARRASRGKTL